MVSLQQIRYLILAGLMVSVSTQPMGWFSSTKAKVGIAALLCASIAAAGYCIWHKIKAQEKAIFHVDDFSEETKKMFEEDKKVLRSLLGDDVIIDPINNRDRDFEIRRDHALFKAINDRNEQNIELLVKWGGKVQLDFTHHEENMVGGNILYPITAIQIKSFLKHGEDIKVYYDKDGILTISGTINRCLGEYLITLDGMGLEQRHLDGALFYYASLGRNKELKLILDHGANVNAKRKDAATQLQLPFDSDSETPIFDAIRWDHLATVKLLLDCGAHIDLIQKDKDGIKYNIYDCNPDSASIIELLDTYRYLKHKDKKDAIADEIFNHPQEIQEFSKDIIAVMASYAADYPLMEERPLKLEQEQEITQVQEMPISKAPAEQPHPLSLDAQAV